MKPSFLRLAAQDADAGAVEGGDPHGVGARADQLLDALLHLARGLVREGDREDLAGVDMARAEQMRDAVGQHPGLAGTGAGDDQQRAAGVHHGGLLLVVEPLQERRRIDGGAGGAVAVVTRSLGGGRVERAAEEVGGDLLRGRAVLVLGRRRGLLALGAEVRQEAVVKEAAHRPPSLGAPLTARRRSSRYGSQTGAAPWCRSRTGGRVHRHGTGRTALRHVTESDICRKNPRIAFRSRKGFGQIEHQPSQEPHELATVLAQAARIPADDSVSTGRHAESGPATKASGAGDPPAPPG